MKKFCDLIWTLLELDNFETLYGQQMTVDYLHHRVSSLYLGGRSTDFNNLFSLLENLDLIRKDEWNRLIITNRGNVILSLSGNKAYELNHNHKKWIAQWYILANNALYRPWFQLLALSPEYECNYHSIPKEMRQLTEEMLYLEVVRREGELVKLEPAYLWALSEYQMKMTESELLEAIERQRGKGELAEEVALNFERARLQSLGWNEQAERVQLISKEYVNAGYDIISYSTPSQIPDRFIEVKSLGDKEVFYWSQNEKVIANFLQDQYYLYLVQLVYQEPIIWAIRNPLKHLDALGIPLRPIQYRIQMDMETLHEHAEEDSVHGIEYRKVAMKSQGDGGNEF